MTPKLSESNAIKYIIKLFDKSKSAHSVVNWYDTIDTVCRHNQTLEGLDESILLLDRINVVGSIVALNRKSWLVVNSKEIMNEDDQCYFVISDKMLSGEDALFLCAAGIYDDVKHSKQDIAGVIKGWVKTCSSNAPFPNIIANSCKIENGNIFSIVAIQLSSTNV